MSFILPRRLTHEPDVAQEANRDWDCVRTPGGLVRCLCYCSGAGAGAGAGTGAGGGIAAPGAPGTCGAGVISGAGGLAAAAASLLLFARRVFSDSVVFFFFFFEAVSPARPR